MKAGVMEARWGQMQLETRGGARAGGERAEARVDKNWGPSGHEGHEKSGEDGSPVSCWRVWGNGVAASTDEGRRLESSFPGRSEEFGFGHLPVRTGGK